MSSLHGTFTRHTEHTIHNMGRLNTEPQFNFSSVRLKFKTGTPVIQLAWWERQRTSRVVAYLFKKAIKLSVSISY